MKRRVLLTSTASALSFGCIGPFAPDEGENEDDEIDPATVGEIVVNSINSARTEEDLDSLEGNEVLLEVSLNHSEYMAEEKELSRVGSQGREPEERVETAGYECEQGATHNAMRIANPSGLGEREAAVTIVDAFLENNSTSESILDPNRTEHGLGVVSRDDYIYVTQTLC